MKIVSKVRTVSKITEEVEKELNTVEAPDVVRSHADFNQADKSVHTVCRLNNKLAATIETAKRPFLDQLQKIDAETKPVRDVISEGITTIKEMMVKYFEKHPDTAILEAGTVMAVVDDVTIAEGTKIPEEYYSVDKKKLIKALKEGVKIKGVALSEAYQVRITEKKY